MILTAHLHGSSSWFVELQFDYHAELKDWIKLIPGRKWLPESKRWRFPYEMLDEVTERAKGYGFEVRYSSGLEKVCNAAYELHGSKYLFDWQRAPVARAVSEDRFIFADETGIGKSVQAIAACQEIGADKILVLCPAGVRIDWKEKFATFWPERIASVGVISASKERGGMSEDQKASLVHAYAAPIQIVNPELLTKLEVIQWSAIIIDEAHMYKKPNSSWSRNLRVIVEANPEASVFALTATPIDDKPMDIWNLLDILWPERFGARQKNGGISYAFKQRYLRHSVNEAGFDVYEGVQHEEEFKKRIAAVSSRHSKSDPEVAKHLPAFDLTMVRVPPPTDYRDSQSGIASREDLERSLCELGAEKLGYTCEWVRDALEVSDHVCVLVHRRGLAKKLHGALLGLSDELSATLVQLDGTVSANRRDEAIRQCKSADKSILVTTLGTCGIGIDLTFCGRAAIIELTYRLSLLIQGAGRFSRLTPGAVPSSLDICVFEGTVDEIIAERLIDKLEDSNAMLPGGAGEEALSAVLNDDDDSIFENEILAMCAGVRKGEYEEFGV